MNFNYNKSTIKFNKIPEQLYEYTPHLLYHYSNGLCTSHYQIKIINAVLTNIEIPVMM